MMNDNATQSALQQLIRDDAVGQLRQRDGLMATLGSALRHEKSYRRVGFPLLFSHCVGSPYHRSPVLLAALWQ